MRADPKQRKRERSWSKHYFLTKEGLEPCVCKAFFLSTLNISLDPVDKALSNKNESGISTGNDGRGFRSPYNRTHEDQRNGIRLHLNLFPCVESLYIRKSITRRFLDSNLTMSKVFHLFKAKYNKEGIEPCSEHLYRQVFSNEFNFAFFKPKKGICVICHRYKQFSPQEKVEKMDEHAAHHKSREDAMKAKARTQGSGRRGRQVYNSIVRLAKCFTIVIKQTSLSSTTQRSTLFTISLFGKGKSPKMGFAIDVQR